MESANAKICPQIIKKTQNLVKHLGRLLISQQQKL